MSDNFFLIKLLYQIEVYMARLDVKFKVLAPQIINSIYIKH